MRKSVLECKGKVLPQNLSWKSCYSIMKVEVQTEQQISSENC